ncbi:MAG: Homoserine kinase [Verrucomicrobia bacterium]|nr:Homoserine kinase [Verrucomicrobiota bacterium]
MHPAPDTVSVRVPASTSNCGAGFDTLGLALSLSNRITVARAAGRTAKPERSDDARAQEMVAGTAALFFRTAAIAPEGFRYRIEGNVPPARGLGSSVTVIAGILAALDALHGTAWTRSKLVGLATQLEGHPDNASAGILGGFCISRCDPTTGAYVDTVRVPVPSELAFVVASPKAEMLTKASREILPSTVPFFDAVRSINSAAYLTAAFATGEFEKLRHAGGDFMHEPYRLPRIPGAKSAIIAAVSAGAFTGWLSGSGSSVLAVCQQSQAGHVLAAMRAAFTLESVAGDAQVLSADNDGLKVE